MAIEKRRVSFEGRLDQGQYDQRVIDKQIDSSTVYFISDTKRIYVGHECYNVTSAAFGGIPVEYTSVLPDGTLTKRMFSEDGDEWRLTFLEKGPDDIDFRPRHTFEFAIEVSEDGTELGVIRIDNKNVGFSNAHAVFCEDVDQIVDGVKTFIGDIRVPFPPKTDDSAASKGYVEARLDDERSLTRKELDDRSSEIREEMRIESERVDGEVSRLDDRIDDEVAASILRDKELDDRITEEVDLLTTKINQEAAAREAEDIRLNDKIDAETDRAIGREDQIDAKLDQEIRDRIDDVDEEEARAKSEEARIESELRDLIDETREKLEDDDREYDSKVVHLAGEETITGDKTFTGDNEFTEPVKGSIEKLTTPRGLLVNLRKYDPVDFDGTSDVTIGIEDVLAVENGGTGKNFDYDTLSAFVRMAEEYEEVLYAGLPNEERIQYLRVKFTPGMIGVTSSGTVKSKTFVDVPHDKYDDGGMSFVKYEDEYAYYRKSTDPIRNQVLTQETVFKVDVVIEGPDGTEVSQTVRTVLIPIWGVRQNWLMGDWGYRLDSQDDDREFYDVGQVQDLLQNVEDLGVVDSAFNPTISYRTITHASVNPSSRGSNYEKGDLLVLRVKEGDEWAAFNHARAYVENVDAAGGIQTISLQYSGLYSEEYDWSEMEAYSNTERTPRSPGSTGSGAKFIIQWGGIFGKTLADLESDPNIILKPGMMVTVLRDETLTPIAAQRYKYFDENRDGKPEWHPWTPYKQSRDYTADGEYVVVDNSETAEGRTVDLHDDVKKRIEYSAQTDEDETITADWTFEGDTRFSGDVRIQEPTEDDNPATMKYVDDSISTLEDKLDTEVDRLDRKIKEETERAETAEGILSDRLDVIETKDVLLDRAGSTEALIDFVGNIASETYVEETRTDAIDWSRIHTTDSVEVVYDGVNGGRASVKVSGTDVDGVANPTLEILPDGLRIPANVIKEKHLFPTLYEWINRKLELSNLTRIRDDDLVFMDTDTLNHRVEINQRPWEFDPVGNYGKDGLGDNRVDWISRKDLVLKRLDQTIQGVKEFVGERYDETPPGKFDQVIYKNGDYIGSEPDDINHPGRYNAIQVPAKVTDVFTDGKDMSDARYGAERNVATEYQLFRLLHDAFSDDGMNDDGTHDTLGDNGLVGTYDTDGIVLQDRENFQTVYNPGVWNNAGTGGWSCGPWAGAERYEVEIQSTWHDVLERRTFTTEYRISSHDVVIERISDPNGEKSIYLSGEHLVNRNQNVDQTIDGTKLFLGNRDKTDEDNISAIFQKSVVIASGRPALDYVDHDSEVTPADNPALIVSGGIFVNKDTYLLEGKSNVLFDDSVGPAGGKPVDYFPSANRYATEMQVYNTVKEMAIVIVQQLQALQGAVETAILNQTSSIKGAEPDNTLAVIAERIGAMATGITEAIEDQTDIIGNEAQSTRDTIELESGNIQTSIGNVGALIEGLSDSFDEFVGDVTDSGSVKVTEQVPLTTIDANVTNTSPIEVTGSMEVTNASVDVNITGPIHSTGSVPVHVTGSEVVSIGP